MARRQLLFSLGQPGVLFGLLGRASSGWHAARRQVQQRQRVVADTDRRG
jgi:hypothetical protein